MGAVTFASATPTAADFGLVTSAQLQHTGFVPGGVTFCACQFLEWGFWGAQADLAATTDGIVHLATWVAGELSATSQLTVGVTTTATYNGHVFGTVNDNGALYEAVGDIALDFTFNTGGAFFFNTASITAFDGTNYAFNFLFTGGGFTTTAYSTATAGFNLQGTHPTAGLVTAILEGNFFGPSTPPDETGGAFKVTNGAVTYTASGTFAAKR